MEVKIEVTEKEKYLLHHYTNGELTTFQECEESGEWADFFENKEDFDALVTIVVKLHQATEGVEEI